MKPERKTEIIKELIIEKIKELENQNRRSDRRIDQHIDVCVQQGYEKNEKFISICRETIKKRESKIRELRQVLNGM